MTPTHSRLFAACLILAGACAVPSRQSPTPTAAGLTNGEARLAVPGGEIWYSLSGTGSGTPVILLHGGPGYSSFYLKPLEPLADERRVVRYDQLGSGKSQLVSDTSLFTIDRFVRELETLRAHLGYDRVHLLGHSWGSILAAEYYRAHPNRVASMVMASPALDIPAWERNARALLPTLSDSAQRAIAEGERTNTYNTPAYQAASQEFFFKYVTLRPNEADLDSIFRTVNEGIYIYMQGPREFTITGTLKRYDATPLLRRIRVPTLYTVGEFDEAHPPTVRYHASLTPGAEVAVISGAAHITTWDNPGEMLRVVREFLRRVDQR